MPQFTPPRPDPPRTRSRAVKHADLIRALESSAARFVASFRDLDPARFHHTPADGGWSIALTAEHVVVSEIGSGKMIGKIAKEPAAPEVLAATAGGEERIEKLLANRGNRREAPEFVRPTGRWTTPAETIEAFQNTRSRTIEFVSTTTADLDACAAPHPALGVLTAAQWAWFLVHHGDRHVAQIDAIKADPGYPG